MRFLADLHIHSKHSHATSRDLDLQHLFLWAKRKGLHVLATGDFTHPAWLSSLQETLQPNQQGLFSLPPHLQRTLLSQDPTRCDQQPVSFLLSTEINCVFKRNKKQYKIHSLIFVPDFSSALSLRSQLQKYGELSANGRPTLQLDIRDLLEIVLHTSPRAHLIPAHIWSPWFSLFSTRSGFESIPECFLDLTEHIFALETGLSSDPSMSWRVCDLDSYTLISNSDAHNPSRIGRQANIFQSELTYDAIFDALRTRDPARFLGTIEVYPQEGKYYYDGHRSCKIRLSPKESHDHKHRCPTCQKPLTLGILNRIEQKADRSPQTLPQHMPPFTHLLPLEAILAQLFDTKPSAKKVKRHHEQLITRFGPELHILLQLPLQELQNAGIPLLHEAIRRIRQGEITTTPGYDGVPGKIQIFHKHERKEAQQTLFPSAAIPQTARQLSLFSPPPQTPPAKAKPKPTPQHSQLSLFRSFPQEETLTSQALLQRFPTQDQAPPTPTPSPAKDTPQPPKLPPPSPQNTQATPQPQTPTTPNPSLQTPKPSTRPPLARKPRYVLPPPTQLLAPLNIEQRTAVMHHGPPLLIVAGPGTGKTKTIAHRIAHLIVSQTLHPTHILALTFSEHAAHQLSQQIDDLVGLYRGVTISSFHGFCLNLLQDEDEICHLIGESERFALLHTIAQQHELPLSPPQIRHILDHISYTKQTQHPSPLQPHPNPQPLPHPAFPALFHAYIQWLHHHQLFDLDDLLFESIQLLLQNPSLQHQLQLRFRSIHVDEFHDLNAAQIQLLQMLTNPQNDLCLAADPDQSIYAFRGTNHHAVTQFEDLFPSPQPTRCSLWRNYRNPQVVIEASQTLIASIPSSNRIQTTPTFQGPSHIQLHTLRDEYLEARFITQHVEALVGDTGYFSHNDQQHLNKDELESLTFSDIAVFYRHHSQLPSLQKALSDADIPYTTAQPNSLLERMPDLKLTLATLRFLSPPQGDWIALHTLTQQWPSLSSLPPLSTLLNTYTSPLAFLTQPPSLPPAQRDSLQTLQQFLQHLRALLHNNTAKQLLEQLLLGLKTHTSSSPRTEHIEFLHEHTATTPSPRLFIQRLLLQQEPSLPLQPSDSISLLHLHAAKDIQRPVVFITACEDGLLPQPNADIHDEIRLFYVAMTRTQQRLYLSRALSRQLDGHRTQLPPSPFLQTIQPFLLESSPAPLPTPNTPSHKAQQELFLKFD